MKKLPLAFALLAAMTLSHSAYALSTEQAPVNTDGSAKYADPDNKTPFAFTGQSASGNGGTYTNTSPGMNYQGAPGLPDSSRQGEDQFNQAYSHVTNSH